MKLNFLHALLLFADVNFCEYLYLKFNSRQYEMAKIWNYKKTN